MAKYVDENLNIYEENQPYVDGDGTKYPGNYPKDGIPGLTAITESPEPVGDVVVSGFTVDEDFNQVWQYRAKTKNELDAEKEEATMSELQQSDAHDVPRILEAILELLIEDGLDMKRLPKGAQDMLGKRAEIRNRLK